MKRPVSLLAALVCSAALMGCATGAPSASTAPAPSPSVAASSMAEPASTVAATEPAPASTPEADVETATEPASATVSSAASFLPVLPSVWNTTIGPDNMTGDCSKGSVLPVYGLVQVTPITGTAGLIDTIEWKNQEPRPYTFKQVQPNLYSYAGPTSIDDGTVTMTVTFESETAFKMVRQFVSRNDPACLHTHDYTGEFKWTR